MLAVFLRRKHKSQKRDRDGGDVPLNDIPVRPQPAADQPAAAAADQLAAAIRGTAPNHAPGRWRTSNMDPSTLPVNVIVTSLQFTTNNNSMLVSSC